MYNKKCKYCNNEFNTKFCSCRAKYSYKKIKCDIGCTKCGNEYDGVNTIKSAHKHYCDYCWKEYQRHWRLIKINLKKERKVIPLFENKVKYLINKIELNNGYVTLHEMNQIITYYQLTFFKVRCGGNTMGEQILDMYNKLKSVYNTDDKKKIIRL